MNEEKRVVVHSGVGFDGLLVLLGIIFCILEGAGAIHWGWVMCCIPFMIIACEIGLVLVLWLIVLICVGIAAAFGDR